VASLYSVDATLQIDSWQKQNKTPAPDDLNIILDSAVGRALMVQHIGLSGESEKIEVTLLVLRLFSDLPGESKGYTSDVRTTAVI
jgi:hypothetical protein